jgi:hypothetical protein
MAFSSSHAMVLYVLLNCSSIATQTAYSANESPQGVDVRNIGVETHIKVAVDGANYARGWSSAYWVEKHKKILFWGGNSHNPRGNNSVRLFDPVTRKTEFLTQNSGRKWDIKTKRFKDGSMAITNRDNQVDFYVPNRDEYWVVGGPGGGMYGGIFDLTKKRWSRIAITPDEFFSGLIKIPPDLRVPINSAHAWCEKIDTGVLFGGSMYAEGPNKFFALIEPDSHIPEPYRLIKLKQPIGARGLLRNSGVCIGEYFYVYGGSVLVNRKVEFKSDLWRFHVPTRTWIQLANGPFAVPYPVMTYDSKRNILVLYGGNKTNNLALYDIANNRWIVKTADAAMRRISHHSGVYSPITDEHLYRGGLRYDRNGKQMNWSVGAQIDSLKLIIK